MNADQAAMYIEIDDDVAVPEHQPRAIVRKSKRQTVKDAVPAALKRCVEAYKEAYKKVYGIVPEVTWSAGYIRVRGNEHGVTKVRLREMTIQLKWRAG